ncbi:ABC transporter ATP-binding protein [Dongia soli]|uniref:ABC transporter ATP-binding protein n=1 Tax=Dongia soli TaxID=600628 RepID=A0ABU5EHJ2_9PROT|nr:ABC transporter ATP-binding protein [Dongia soli]MDY0885339.1 ABC transporter ATP-binding protein [Dongia soli]
MSAVATSPAATHAPLLDVRNLSKSFGENRSLLQLATGKPARVLQAVRNVSLAVRPGETLGVVGESGCGKSTLGRCIAGLYDPSAGEVLWQGKPLSAIGDRKAASRQIQMIFQDPYSSLNPRMSVEQTLEEVLKAHGLVEGGKARSERVEELLLTVGLPPRLKDRLPHALSGGQRQRVSIARALAVEPQLIVADEPVSALDASVQAQIINLFEELRDKFGIAFIFIAHDLNVVRHISHRIAVMYLGEVVELAEADALFDAPRHPYTKALLSAIPFPDPDRRTAAAGLEGELPDPLNPPAGCSFSTRCAWVEEACRARRPDLEQYSEGHLVRCRRMYEIA